MNSLDSLFPPPAGPELLPMRDAEVLLYHQFFPRDRADTHLQTLIDETPWRQDQFSIYGKTMDVPRLTAWYGDEGKSYSYSGLTLTPQPWTPTLLEIKTAIEEVTGNGVVFNSVLVNYYRSERDSVAWHSDDEHGLGKNPVIGSVSFGATRSFHFRHAKDKTVSRVKVDLTHGSYLLMRGTTQEHWQHQIPKTTRKCGPRINLTFRIVLSA